MSPSPAETPKPKEPDSYSAVQEIDWSDFRDHLATADQEGRRLWLYPRKPHGRFYHYRTWLSYVLIGLMFAGPFIRIHGNPLLMINVVERKFSVLGVLFWPQDNLVFALGLLLFLTGIAVFTAAFGRLWCGWTCPQTVMMEMVFRKIEYFIEGDAPEQKALDRGPWTLSKLVKKAAKHLIFLGLSFLIGNTLLAYIIGSDELLRIVTDPPGAHGVGLTFMILFTLVFYGIFARFREQACTFICPYGRFQSTLLDENSIVVAYDHQRGEQRGKLHRDETRQGRAARGAGDCVDCHQCVVVCPTGIDIRNGTQMECVNCTACIDACDSVMDKIGRPWGLIRFASLNGIERGEKLRLTPRLMGYCAILLLLGVGLVALLLTRSDVDATLLRAQGGLFQSMPSGKISNLYTLKLTNKTQREMPVELRMQSPAGIVTVLGRKALVVPGEDQFETSVLIEIAPDDLAGRNTPVLVDVYSAGRKLDRIKTSFVGPR
ncbi:MAG: cytochrome c oxidase accessory protein CcoG [Verrucomicrobia bacterium]|jgi:cytochrome c oxidase accessory protein FixG|nr:cytochrome c oxidase accessory protein CcoG [Verrucomicrobiota bacterium]